MRHQLLPDKPAGRRRYSTIPANKRVSMATAPGELAGIRKERRDPSRGDHSSEAAAAISSSFRTSWSVSECAASSNMKLSTSCGMGALQTGAKDWRCKGEGPCSRRAAM